MATYLPPGSNVKGDTMQTLYLMNPSYAGYTDSPNSGNMVLVGSASNPVGNISQNHQQQSYMGFSLPPHVSQQSHTVTTNMSHQNVSSEMFTNCGNSQGYSWNGGNELMFIPSSDMREENQSLATRLSSITPSGQHSASGLRNISQESFQDQQVAFIPSGITLSEGMQAPSGAGQILSLSLSPQPSMILNQLHHHPFPVQQSNLGLNNGAGFADMMTGTEGYPAKGERMYSNQWMMAEGGLSSLRIFPNVLVSNFQDHLIGGSGGGAMVANSRHVNGMFSTSSPKADIYSSKYLKCAQELLNEVVSVGKDAKDSINPSSKANSWAAPTSYETTSFQDKDSVETNGKDGVASMASWVTEKDIVPCVSIVANNTGGIPDQNVEQNIELTTAEKQEIQMKKSKLMTMLDEVDQRYRQYHHQMQTVVTSFESTAGFGAARTYTALALQTISKHFRCLKDAIRGQIRATCKALGDEEVWGGQGKGEISRLRFIDQHLRQQRALQQIGMMQHHPWRPQRGLPERSVSVLRAWLFEHFLHPYPKDSDKVHLARQTGLTRNQVSNWFINARVRLWKPMVEEMYAEEMRESTEGIEEADNNPSQSDGDEGGGKTNKNNCAMLDSSGNNDQNSSKSLLRTTLPEPKSEEFLDIKKNVFEENGGTSDVVMMIHQGNNNMKPPESFLFHEKQIMGQGAKKARNGDSNNSSSFLSPNLSSTTTTTMTTSSHGGYKADDLHGAEMLTKLRTEDENTTTTTNRHLDIEYGMNIPQDSILNEDDRGLRGYGMFQLSGLNRYPNEGLATENYALTNNGVSLTLGLQHSDGLSLSGSPQPYLQGGHGHMDMVMRRQDGVLNASNFYGIHDVATGNNSGQWQLPRGGFNSSR